MTVGLLLSLTLPALVIALTVLGVIEVLRGSRRRSGTAMSSTGFDVLTEALYPSKRHEVQQREAEALMAEEDEDGAPPRSRIDLARGRAHIVIDRPR